MLDPHTHNIKQTCFKTAAYTLAICNLQPAGKKMDQAPKILFISNIMDLLVIQKDTSSIISEAYAVSPSYLNGSHTWKIN